MKPFILFRRSLDEENEYNVALKYWSGYISEFRTLIPSNSLVIGRYSVLPFYLELEKELKITNSHLLNSYHEHQYIADIANWYNDIKDYTPTTYFTWGLLPEGSYIVKGRTNSRKFEWNRKMFADSKEKLLKVIETLLDDSLVSEQGLCVRDYIPLETYEIGINGMRFTNEWRCFYIGTQLIDYGYYWSIYDGPRQQDLDREAFKLLEKVSSIISQYTNGYVIDIAKTEKGEWIVIEINDLQMSGLSEISPDRFYRKLRDYFNQ